jgi:ABC-type multidrug transport system fused ATPase/permease subunit
VIFFIDSHPIACHGRSDTSHPSPRCHFCFSVVPRAICQIEFKNVTLRYLPWLDPSLIDLSFHIRGGEKIGVCGRTGSGKSTTSASSLALESLFSLCVSFSL